MLWWIWSDKSGLNKRREMKRMEDRRRTPGARKTSVSLGMDTRAPAQDAAARHRRVAPRRRSLAAGLPAPARSIARRAPRRGSRSRRSSRTWRARRACSAASARRQAARRRSISASATLSCSQQLVRVDRDRVALLHQRDRPAGIGLGRDVADHHAPGAAREAPVGDQADRSRRGPGRSARRSARASPACRARPSGPR